MSTKISVVMPAYNLEGTIAKNIGRVRGVLERLSDQFEIIVVSDGSQDRTFEEAERVSDGTATFAYHYTPNRGKGYALRYGGSRATGEVVIFLDGDLDINPETIILHYELLRFRRVDAVVGSKRHGDSKVHYPALRRLYSFVYQRLLWLLFGLRVKDTQVGIKMFKKELLDSVLGLTTINGYAFDIELLVLASRKGFTIAEGPVDLLYQFTGSGISVKSILEIIRDTLIIFRRDRLLDRYSPKPSEPVIPNAAPEVIDN